MNDDLNPLPDHRLLTWRRVFDDPAVQRIELDGDTVRVRLRSGVELEWPWDASDRDAGGPQ